MSRRFQDILYWPVYALFAVLSWMPMWLLYRLSDFLYCVIYYIVGYRRDVVRDNIEKAFPEKSVDEQRKIEKKFYHYFADYMVETIKLLHISEEEIRRRMQFVNTELVDSYTQQGRSVILLMGHYCNWEWTTSFPLWMHLNDKIVPRCIYSPLHNEWFDRLFLRLRSRFGLGGIPMQRTLRELLRYSQEGKTSITVFLSDQSPDWRSIHHHSTFLGRETAVITGYETIARKMDMVLIYTDIEVVKRGYYKATYRLIEDDPASRPQFEVVDKYIEALEQTIRRTPHAWLWSHRRWKYTPSPKKEV